MVVSAAKSSNNKYLDIAGTVFDIVTDFIPGVGTAKDIYNVYQTIVDPKSKVADIALALVKTSAAKIRKMDIEDTRKLVNASEGKDRGHTKDRHLNITDEKLQNRSKTEAKEGASRFSSQKVMNEFVNNVLDKEADKIASWLKSSNKKDFASGKHKSATSLGDGYIYDAKKKTYKHIDKLNTGKVVLRKDDSNEYGFIVLTSYPIVKK
ncbi:RNase A-like domain-containing protein [Lysinibacillus sp. NPDC093190]|uniref:RNase A-like domain-containing protein n=1 Tax=Lysinibacillus sp. NPDC093190 TaxID=3390575 RepID=UPI003D00493D